MGSEVSRPLIDSPEDWEQNGKDFQIISPVSDLSNPSDIYKVHRHFNQPQQVKQQSQQRKAASRGGRQHHEQLNHQQHPPTKESIPAPSAFYFPTKETERATELAHRRSVERPFDSKAHRLSNGKENDRPNKGNLIKAIRKTKQVMSGCFADNSEEDRDITARQHQLKQQQVHEANSKKRAMKMAKKVEEEEEEDEQPTPAHHPVIHPQNVIYTSEARARQSTGSDQHRNIQRQLSNVQEGSSHSSKRSSTSSSRQSSIKSSGDGIQKHVEIAKSAFVVRETEGLVQPEEYLQSATKAGKSATLDTTNTDGALHEEEAYFSRLTGSAAVYGNIQDSPLMPAANAQALRNVPSTLDVVDQQGHEDDRSTLSSPTQDGTQEDTVEAETPSSNLLRQFSKSGAGISMTPGYYPDLETEKEDKEREVFEDTTFDSGEEMIAKDRPSIADMERASLQSKASGFHQTKARESMEDSSTVEDNQSGLSEEDGSAFSYSRLQGQQASSAFRPRLVEHKRPFKQVASLGPSSSKDVGEQVGKPEVSKLEALFRPVLPALSADDMSVGSFDPYVIKVTESAPAIMRSRSYVGLTLRSSLTPTISRSVKRDYGVSPSMMSMDSQLERTPTMTKMTVSDEARSNADFLFSEEFAKQMHSKQSARSGRGSGASSISTRGSRNRVENKNHHSTVVTIPGQNSLKTVSLDDDDSKRTTSSRRVRFSSSEQTIDALPINSTVSVLQKRDSTGIPRLESKMSDLTDNTASLAGRASLGDDTIVSVVSDIEAVDDATADAGNDGRIQWSYSNGRVTPALKGKELQDATNSPYLRFQAAKNKFGSKQNDREEPQLDVEVPIIKAKKETDAPDVATSEFSGRASVGTVHSLAIESIPEEDEEEEDEEVESTGENETESQRESMAASIHWSYTEKGVTPALKGKDKANQATKSPFRRFNNAKTKFSGKQEKDLPVKSPMKRKKIVRRAAKATSIVCKPSSGGGLVSGRIQGLEQRITVAKKNTKKYRKAVAYLGNNPRRYDVVANVIRTRSIVNYRTDTVNLDKMNATGAVKFNKVPDILFDADDSSVESDCGEEIEEIHGTQIEKQQATFDRMVSAVKPVLSHGGLVVEESLEDDEISKLTLDDLSKAPPEEMSKSSTEKSEALLSPGVSSVATHRQQRSANVPPASSRVSFSTQTTACSGLTRIKKQVFRDSTATVRQSMSSNSDSTTMSSILGKENNSYTFRDSADAVNPSAQKAHAPQELQLSPTRKTPMQAQKWRSLAAAAKHRDTIKAKSSKKKKSLSLRSNSSYPWNQ